MTPEQKTLRLARLRWRYHNEPAYRERVLEQQRQNRQKPEYRTKEIARKRRWTANASPEYKAAKRKQYHDRAMERPEHRRAQIARARLAKLRRLGMTEADYDRMFRDQGGVCALCGRPPQNIRLAVDHDHVTGRVRGLLCGICNRSLGYFGDTAEALQRVVVYLTDERGEA